MYTKTPISRRFINLLELDCSWKNSNFVNIAAYSDSPLDSITCLYQSKEAFL